MPPARLSQRLSLTFAFRHQTSAGLQVERSALRSFDDDVLRLSPSSERDRLQVLRRARHRSSPLTHVPAAASNCLDSCGTTSTDDLDTNRHRVSIVPGKNCALIRDNHPQAATPAWHANFQSNVSIHLKLARRSRG